MRWGGFAFNNTHIVTEGHHNRVAELFPPVGENLVQGAEMADPRTENSVSHSFGLFIRDCHKFYEPSMGVCNT